MNKLKKLHIFIFVFCFAASLALGMRLVDADEYASTKQPLWQVGNLNKDLSFACRRGRFNQEHSFRLTIGYTGKKGQGITGMAKKGWNLKDPRNLGQPGYTYHFFHDGLTDCKVYVSKNLKRQQ